jgi:carbamoyl-phosphate synthase large subunit
MLESLGIPVVMTTKKLNEGHPNVLDVITDGLVNGVLNTLEVSTARGDQMKEGFEIRRAAVERRIPCFTWLDTARVVAACLASEQHDYDVRSITEYWSFDPESVRHCGDR